MDENCKRQKEVERTYGGLLPAVEGHSLGTRYKVQAKNIKTAILTEGRTEERKKVRKCIE